MIETDRQVLERFLYPLSIEKFLQDFTRRPIFIKGNADKFAGMIDASRLLQMLRRFAPHPAETLKVSFPSVALSAIEITPDQARPLFDAGATVCVAAVQRFDANLARFAAAIKGELNYTGLVSFNCYWSPDNSGFQTHYDARTATTLQIDGSKRWRFSREPAIPVPSRNALVDKQAQKIIFGDGSTAPHPWERLEVPDESTFEEVLLEPGDILSLPAGHWHSAAASGHSLALNLAFEARSFLDELIALAVADLRQDPAFRDALPMALDQGAGLPPEVRASVEHILGGLRARINALEAESPLVRDAWRSAVSTAHATVLDRNPSVAASGTIAPDQRLEVLRDAPRKLCLEEEEGQPRVVLFYNGTRVSLPAKARSLLEAILAQEVFVAGDTATWGAGYKWAQLEPLLQNLVGCGLLRRLAG